MRRDFRQSTQDELKALVEQANVQWFDWTDAIGDFCLNHGLADVIGALGGTEAHQRALFDQNNTSKAELQAIFNKVYDVENAYGAKFKTHVEELHVVHEKLIQSANPIIIRSDYTSATSELNDVAVTNAYLLEHSKYADYLNEHPEAYEAILSIVLYENSHKKYVDQTNRFLSVLDTEDEIAIKGMIYQQDEPMRTLCLKYLDQFRIADATYDGLFDPLFNVLKFNAEYNRDEPRGRYYVFFHELGHAIDCYYAREHGSLRFYSDTFTINGLTLADVNRNDVRAGLTANAYALLERSNYSSFTQSQKDTIASNVVNNLMLQNRNFDTLSAEEQDFQALLRTRYKTILTGANNEAASDIYGGVTDNTIVGSYGHTPPAISNYWYNQSLKLVINETNKECFAEYFGRMMTNDPAKARGLDSINRLLPESKIFLDQMIVGMN